MPEGINVIIEDDVQTIKVDPETGTIEELQPDGSVIVKLDAEKPGNKDPEEDPWFSNQIDKIDPTTLQVIVNDLLAGIQADDSSRSGWLENVARGLDIVGLKLSEPKGEAAGELNVSSVTNPLLLEALLKGWANSQAELLPASGPVKIENNGRDTVERDQLAEEYEKGFNHFLTDIATEFYPSTSRMLLWGTYFTGSGFKKIYRCPLRRRPVSEVVPPANLIVSDASEDFRSCERITHKITMRPSMFKRMVLNSVYRSTEYAPQPNATPNVVEAKVAGIQGTSPVPERAEDQPYTIYESQCELDIDDLIPAGSKFKGEGIPLPYLVCIEKDSQSILSIRRDWDEDDEECQRLRLYVQYPYVPGPGFYNTGLLNILGNSSAAMTAAWREALDCGMYANFPGGFISKQSSRQNTSNFRLSPGEFVQIDAGGGSVRDAISALPYKDVTTGLLQLMDKITEQSRALGQGAEIPAAEGLQNVPVGTMLAQIEQATKIMAAAHKGLHTAMSSEMQMFADLFRRNPEDFWRMNKKAPRDFWTEERLLKALESVTLTPVSDPNVPSHIHRVAKALGLVQLIAVPEFKPLMDPMETLRRVLVAMREDANGLIKNPDPQTPQIDPMAQAKMADAQAKIVGAQTKAKEADLKHQTSMAEIASKERISENEITEQVVIREGDQARLQAEFVRDTAEGDRKHTIEREKLESDRDIAAVDASVKMMTAGVQAQKAQHEVAMGEREHQLDRRRVDTEEKRSVSEQALAADKAAHEAAVKTHTALNPPKPASKSTPKKK